MIKKIILDVDGVLADFTTAAFAAHGKDSSYQIPGEYSMAKCMGMTDEEFWAKLDNYEFWASVKPYEEAGYFAGQLSGVCQIVVATIPSNSSGSVQAKAEWLKKYMPSFDHLIGKKMHLAQPGYLLIDDFDKNVEAWREAGGVALLYPRPWNSRYKETGVGSGWSRTEKQIADQVLEEVNELVRRDRLSNAQEPYDILFPAKQALETQKVEAAKGWVKEILSGETRITDPVTGGQKGSKVQRYDLLPARQLHELAEIYGIGSAKYADRNWERGYKWSLSFASLMRHAWLFWAGTDRDKETGKKHILHAAWHCLALAEFMDTHKAGDDRVKEVAKS